MTTNTKYRQSDSQTPQSAMTQALNLKQPEGVDIPSERTIYRIMEEIGVSHPPRHKPNGVTKADREARKSDALLKRDFHADRPLEKCVTDITEIKASYAYFHNACFKYLKLFGWTHIIVADKVLVRSG